MCKKTSSTLFALPQLLVVGVLSGCVSTVPEFRQPVSETTANFRIASPLRNFSEMAIYVQNGPCFEKHVVGDPTRFFKVLAGENLRFVVVGSFRNAEECSIAAAIKPAKSLFYELRVKAVPDGCIAYVNAYSRSIGDGVVPVSMWNWYEQEVVSGDVEICE